MPNPGRDRAVTRLEGFSDAVFGFALTLLVVSLQTPGTTAELRDLLAGVVPFAVTFAMVVWIWYEHNVFFRRYGMQDPWTVFLNSVLLFVVLFYVYPLKFLSAALLGRLFIESDTLPRLAGNDGWLVMFMYSTGVLLIFGTFVLLHRHAWRRRASLDLDEGELLTLRFSTRAHVLSMSVAVASLAMLFILPNQSMWAGIIYSVMGPIHAWNGYRNAAAHEALAKRESAPAEEPQSHDETHAKPD
jgi:uncharacterized membrane protein